MFQTQVTTMSMSNKVDASSQTMLPEDSEQQPPASASAVTSSRSVDVTWQSQNIDGQPAHCQQTVTLPAAEFNIMRQRVMALELQLKTMHNLQLVLQHTERQLVACRQQLVDCRLERERAELMLERATRRRLQERPHRQSPADLERSGPAGRQHDSVEFRTSAANEVTPSGSDAEEDGCAGSQPVTTELHKDVGDCRRGPVQPAGMTGRKLNATTAATSVGGSCMITGNDLMEKVMQQNARLKRTLREIIASRGMTVAQYLVSHIA